MRPWTYIIYSLSSLFEGNNQSIYYPDEKAYKRVVLHIFLINEILYIA